MGELPLSPVDRLIRKAGAERVSSDAAEELAEVLEEEGKDIASIAKEYSEEADRKTIKRKDIENALKL